MRRSHLVVVLVLRHNPKTEINGGCSNQRISELHRSLNTSTSTVSDEASPCRHDGFSDGHRINRSCQRERVSPTLTSCWIARTHDPKFKFPDGHHRDGHPLGNLAEFPHNLSGDED